MLAGTKKIKMCCFVNTVFVVVNVTCKVNND